MESCELQCMIIVENINATGHVSQRQKLQDCLLTLGRDQFKDIIVKISSTKSSRQQEISMKNIKLFKKFIREGKATIRTQDKIQILISNCPPDKLAMFLKVLAVKTGIRKAHASDKTKLYSCLPKDFNFISPLTENDVHSYTNQLENKSLATMANKQSTKSCLASNDETPKRKRTDTSMSAPRKRINSCLNQETSTSSAASLIAKKSAYSSLSKEQKEILDAVLQGQNVFFTGSAGTGKSYLLKRILGALPPMATVASASTGVAACHIGGITLHSFAGIGSGSADLQMCYQLASRPSVKQQWKKCQHLIIDEISMIDAAYFDKLEAVARYIRKSSSPFGGIQLILCGDFLQLPPVFKKDEKVVKRFCFQADSWRNCIHANFELTEVRRQTDNDFINILQHIRVGKCPEHIQQKLETTSTHTIEQHGIQATKLCTHKVDVEEVNELRMKNLKGDVKIFFAVDSDSYYSTQMDKYLPAKQRLELKIGAQVMLTKNLDVQRGLVNGARGVVTRFETNGTSTPVIRFVHGSEIVMKMERFIFGIPGGGMVTRKQYPVKLAWAISIHKSQGLTLDCVEVSLARVFEDGQAYVALSRAKTFQGLRILDFNRQCIRAHPDVLKFYIRLRREMRMFREMRNDNLE
eukprot:gene7930-8785_t